MKLSARCCSNFEIKTFIGEFQKGSLLEVLLLYSRFAGDLFQMNPEKRHSFLNCIVNMDFWPFFSIHRKQNSNHT